MGFYDDGQFRSTRKRGDGGGGQGLKWIAVVVVSALIGSAATLVAVPAMLENGAISAPLFSNVNLQDASYKTVAPVTLSIGDAIEQAVKKVTPSVVGVINYQEMQTGMSSAPSLQEYGVGSGVIFDPRGYIVTNNHVVQGATKVEVVVNKHQHVYAQVIGTDPYTDLAVLKIPSSYVTPQDVAQFGNSNALVPGEPAIAIGNPAGLDFADSVTVGVISATQRVMPVYDEATGQELGEETELQTDAAINPGNSGGPLVNAEGQVVGINNSKIVAHGFEGMGFSIPINEVRTIIQQILATGHAQHPALGIGGFSLTSIPQAYWPNVPVNYGVYVEEVSSPEAQAGGLEKGDVIVGIDGQKVTGITSLKNYLWNHFKPGDSVTVTVYRGQQKLNLKVQLVNLQPPAQPSADQGNGAASGQGSGSGGSITIPDPFGGSGSGNGGSITIPNPFGGSSGGNGSSGGSSGGFPFP